MNRRNHIIARVLLREHGALHMIPEEYRWGHRTYETLRARGLRLEDMPPKVRALERVYQAVRHQQRKLLRDGASPGLSDPREAEAIVRRRVRSRGRG